MSTLEFRITTKLDRKKLDKETMFIQHKDLAGILLNEINHIYGRISLSREQEQTANTDRLPEAVVNVIDEVMKYEPELLVPNINDHIFTNNEGVDDDGGDDKENDMAMNVAGVMVRPCLMHLVKVGWNKLREMNVKKIRMVTDERTQQKRRTMQYILDRVTTMKLELMSTNIPVKQDNVEESEWVSYLWELKVCLLHLIILRCWNCRHTNRYPSCWV
jgi:hypothetical protein